VGRHLPGLLCRRHGRHDGWHGRHGRLEQHDGQVEPTVGRNCFSRDLASPLRLCSQAVAAARAAWTWRRSCASLAAARGVLEAPQEEQGSEAMPVTRRGATTTTSQTLRVSMSVAPPGVRVRSATRVTHASLVLSLPVSVCS